MQWKVLMKNTWEKRRKRFMHNILPRNAVANRVGVEQIYRGEHGSPRVPL